MKPFALLAGVLAALLPESALAQSSPESLDLVLPQDRRIRIEVTVEGESPAAKWDKFLDRWFDYFDIDGGGMLTRVEADRIFPLPLPNRQEVRFDFAKADADGNSKVTRAELKAFYRRGGFTPLLSVVIPASIENLRLGDRLFGQLGPDAGGKLTAVHFKRAASLLRKFDENEDEVLTIAEILSVGEYPAQSSPNRAALDWATPTNKTPEACIRVELGEAPMQRIQPIGKSLRADSVAIVQRVRHEQAVLAFPPTADRAVNAAVNSNQFVLAQFRNVAGKNLAIEKRQVVDDPSLQLLADVFPHADRNRDGKLTLAELERFLALVEEGVACPLVLTLTECGRNLFCHLDRNADGRLDVLELNTALAHVTALGGAGGWTRNQVPHYIQITVQRGFAGDAFGPLPLATPTSVSKALVSRRSTKGPAWFQAMDRNGDGFVSPCEFLGPREIFLQLDRDGDGLISVDEAEQIDKKRP